jgi:ankyrin repeat protein
LETATIDPDETDNYGWTPLHHAAQNGHLEIVKVLLKHGADKSLEGKDPELSPWLVAIAAGQTKLIEELMPKEKKRAERQALWEHAMFLAVKNAQFETALHLSNIEV